MNAIVLFVKVKKLISVPKKHMQKIKVCGNPKLLEKINKEQLNQEKREDLLPQM